MAGLLFFGPGFRPEQGFVLVPTKTQQPYDYIRTDMVRLWRFAERQRDAVLKKSGSLQVDRARALRILGLLQVRRREDRGAGG